MDSQGNLEQDSVKKLILVKNQLKLNVCVIKTEGFLSESRRKRGKKPVRMREAKM